LIHAAIAPAVEAANGAGIPVITITAQVRWRVITLVASE